MEKLFTFKVWQIQHVKVTNLNIYFHACSTKFLNCWQYPEWKINTLSDTIPMVNRMKVVDISYDQKKKKKDRMSGTTKHSWHISHVIEKFPYK
jgi:hypothetical protein